MSETRLQSFEGEIKKCPSCGAVLPSMVTKCSECGYEIRNSDLSSSMKNFFELLNATEDLAEKANLIKSFPIPNTKEDIMEFMIFAASEVIAIQKNQNNNGGFDTNVMGNFSRAFGIKTSDVLYKEAWEIKLEQVLTKAKILFINDKESLAQVNAIVNEIDKHKKKNKSKRRNFWILYVLFVVLFFGGVYGGIFGYPQIKKSSEIKRLDQICRDVEFDISAKNYAGAELKLLDLKWTYTSDAIEKKETETLIKKYQEKQAYYQKIIDENK